MTTATRIGIGALLAALAAAPPWIDAKSGGTPTTVVTPEIDDLIGCYGARKGGAPQIRVTKRDGRYFVNVGPRWDHEAEAKPPTDDELQKLFAKQRHLYVAGLHANHIGVFKVRPGVTVRGKAASGEYVLAFFTDHDVGYRVDCPRD
jgi:hypothetical protein